MLAHVGVGLDSARVSSLARIGSWLWVGIATKEDAREDASPDGKGPSTMLGGVPGLAAVIEHSSLSCIRVLPKRDQDRVRERDRELDRDGVGDWGWEGTSIASVSIGRGTHSDWDLVIDEA